MNDFNYLQELAELAELTKFINDGPYSSEAISEDHIVVYNKDMQPVMAFGKYWIEK